MFKKSVELVKQGVVQGIFPSAALSIGVGAKNFVKDAWGSTSLYPPGDPVNTYTSYDIASLSKIVSTSTVALRMMEQGLLSTGDTVKTFFSDAPETHADITVFQLMTHTSGIRDHEFLSKYCSDRSKVAYTIMQIPLRRPSGTQTEYSCLGYILLGKILEKIGGKTLDKLAKAYVWQPLKMTHTSYHPSGSIALTERDEHGQWLCGIVHDENACFLRGISGNAGVFSCLEDMLRYTTMLACGGSIDGNVFLSPATLKAASANYTPGLYEHRGLGFKHIGGAANFFGDFMGEHSFGHTGFTGTSIVVDPCTGLHVVLLTNRVHPTRENTQLIRFRRLLHNCIATELSRANG